jgi:hypothetical protein
MIITGFFDDDHSADMNGVIGFFFSGGIRLGKSCAK